jgi:hypothetical protein
MEKIAENGGNSGNLDTEKNTHHVQHTYYANVVIDRRNVRYAEKWRTEANMSKTGRDYPT